MSHTNLGRALGARLRRKARSEPAVAGRGLKTQSLGASATRQPARTGRAMFAAQGRSGSFAPTGDSVGRASFSKLGELQGRSTQGRKRRGGFNLFSCAYRIRERGARIKTSRSRPVRDEGGNIGSGGAARKADHLPTQRETTSGQGVSRRFHLGLGKKVPCEHLRLGDNN